MIRAKLLSFSPGGEKLAQGGSDGVLRIWGTSTGRLEQEYQPAEHLIAKPSCLQFAPLTSISPKKKKKKASADSEYSLLAMGTKGGRVLVYSLEKKEVLTTLTHAPPHVIRDVAWHSPTRLFSLAADDTLVEWDLTTGERIFSCEVNGGSSMCALDKKNLCIGKSKIHHIHLLKKSGEAKVQQTFTGHTSQVSQLVAIPASTDSAKYFLSASQDDRFVYAWNVDDDNSEASASFLVSDRVCGLTVKTTQDNTISVIATTHKGALVYFTQHLNGNKQKKAIKCTGTLSIHSESESDLKTTIPILCSFFVNDIEESVIIVYGDSTFLKFERICVKQLKGKQELVRSVAASLPKTETSLTQTHTPDLASDAVVLGPASINLSLSQKKKGKKRKRDEVCEETVTMEEKLNALSVDQSASTALEEEKEIKGSNQVHTLVQGLHSGDPNLLRKVIKIRDPKEIRKIVHRLPTVAVVPLITYITSLMPGRDNKASSAVKWLKCVLYRHMGHLSTLSNRDELMSPFLSEATNRAAALRRMSELHARLDLVLHHVSDKQEEAKMQSRQQTQHQPLLTYEEESSDEEDMIDGFGVSETEDNWEEMSNFGEINGHPDNENVEMEVDHNSSRKRTVSVESVESVSESESDSDDDDEEEEDEEAGTSDNVDYGEGSENDSDHVLVLSEVEDEDE